MTPRKVLTVTLALFARSAASIGEGYLCAQPMPMLMTVVKQMDTGLPGVPIAAPAPTPSPPGMALDDDRVRHDGIFGLQPTSSILPSPISMSMTDQRTASYLCLLADRKLSHAPARCYHRLFYELASVRQCMNRQITMRLANCTERNRSPIHGNI
jgi:hypothetical protein